MKKDLCIFVMALANCQFSILAATNDLAPLDKEIPVSWEWSKSLPPIPEQASFESVVDLFGHMPNEMNLDSHNSGSAWWTFRYTDSFENVLLLSCQCDFRFGQTTGAYWIPQANRTEGKNYTNTIISARAAFTNRMSKLNDKMKLPEIETILGGNAFTGYLDEEGNGTAYWRFYSNETGEDRTEMWILLVDFHEGRYSHAVVLPKAGL